MKKLLFVALLCLWSGAAPAQNVQCTTRPVGDDSNACASTAFVLNQIAASASFAFPITVSGSVNSGGIPYFNSTTQMSSSATLAANALVIGGGAGTAPSTTTTGTGVLTALGIATNSSGGIATYPVPISGGVSGLGTGVATALGNNTNSSGGFVTDPVAISTIATIAANTFLANVTGSTAAPTAASLPSCSGNNDAMIYTSGTGLGCGTAFASLSLTNQTVSGGANDTSFSIGTLTTGTTTINCGNQHSQYFTNNGTFTLAAPANDGYCYLLMTNGASAVIPTFSGFTQGSNSGDTITNTSGSLFGIMIARTNGTSHYLVTAYQ